MICYGFICSNLLPYSICQIGSKFHLFSSSWPTLQHTRFKGICDLISRTFVLPIWGCDTGAGGFQCTNLSALCVYALLNTGHKPSWGWLMSILEETWDQNNSFFSEMGPKMQMFIRKTQRYPRVSFIVLLCQSLNEYIFTVQPLKWFVLHVY